MAATLPAYLRRLSDLHVYLTVPFVLSWSCLDAMACGCTVLGSDTAPVREVIADGENGLLCDFFDDAAMAERALEMLAAPDEHRERLGAAAARTIADRYALDVTFPEMAAFYERVASGDSN